MLLITSVMLRLVPSLVVVEIPSSSFLSQFALAASSGLHPCYSWKPHRSRSFPGFKRGLHPCLLQCSLPHHLSTRRRGSNIQHLSTLTFHLLHHGSGLCQGNGWRSHHPLPGSLKSWKHFCIRLHGFRSSGLLGKSSCPFHSSDVHHGRHLLSS